jgi:hypothetical protein
VTLDGGGTSVLSGDRAYEGLTTVAHVSLDGEVSDWQGSIIEGKVPPMPAPPAEADWPAKAREHPRTWGVEVVADLDAV